MSTVRVIRRVGRTVAANAAISAASAAQRASKRAEDEAKLVETLQSLANVFEQSAELEKQRAALEAQAETIMKEHKIGTWTEGMLKAEIKATYSNEKKEVDARALFNSKHMPREHYFECVKVQVGELGKYLSENEIKNLAKITPRALTGHKLVVTPVKTVAATKPGGRKAK